MWKKKYQTKRFKRTDPKEKEVPLHAEIEKPLEQTDIRMIESDSGFQGRRVYFFNYYIHLYIIQTKQTNT